MEVDKKYHERSPMHIVTNALYGTNVKISTFGFRAREPAAFLKKNFTRPATFMIRNKFSFMISFICTTAGTIRENSISTYIIAGEICFRYASGIKIMYDERKNDVIKSQRQR